MLGGVDIVNSAERHLRHDERRLANDDGVTANPTLPAALSAEGWEKRRRGVFLDRINRIDRIVRPHGFVRR